MKKLISVRAHLPVPAAIAATMLLTSCGGLFHSHSEAVVYALGSRDAYTSPLNGNLKPACPALRFDDEDFEVAESHEPAIRSVFKEVEDDKKVALLIVGYAPPTLPQDHARSLSERRAQAVRQRLIELGMEAASIQTVGFGNDFSPSGPSSGVVVIYRQR